MAFRNFTPTALILACLPLLAACNQTASPANPGLVGSGALAAINDMQETRARHRVTSTVLNYAGAFDPTGLSGYAINHVEEQQSRIEDEKSQRVEEEVQKSLAEAEALQALSEDLERQKASASGKPSRRKATP